jgi:DNA end-binding protein Ku
MAMPRSLWNGTIAFGLVRVPVKLHSATESKRIAFKERHAADGAAIEHRRVCVKERKEVPYDEIVKGFEVSAGSYVVLSKRSWRSPTVRRREWSRSTISSPRRRSTRSSTSAPTT